MVSLHSKNSSRAHRPVCMAQAGPARPGSPSPSRYPARPGLAPTRIRSARPKPPGPGLDTTAPSPVLLIRALACFAFSERPTQSAIAHDTLPGHPADSDADPHQPLQPGLLRLIRARATAYPQHPTPGTLTGAARGCYFVHADKHGPTSQAGPLKPTSSSRAAPADLDDAPIQSGPLRLTRMRATPAPASQSCKSLGDLRPRGVAAGAGLRSTTTASGSQRAGSPI